MTEPNVQQYYHGWNLIRSEPDIFTTMIRNYGINGVIAEDVFTLDDLPTLSKGDTYGILLAYRYAEDPLPENATDEDPDAEDIIFIPQFITNSCATVGLLNVLCNAPIRKGDIIDRFIDFTDGFTNIDRGIALGNNPVFRDIHNSYSFEESDIGSGDEQEGQQRPGTGTGGEAGTEAEAVDVDVAKEQIPDKPASSDSDSVDSGLGNAYHFVAYIFHNHFIWELDGLKPYPIKLQRVNSRASWLNVLRPILTDKIESSGLTANIISIVKDPMSFKEEEVSTLLGQSAKLDQDIAKEEAKGQPSGSSSSTAKSRKMNKKKAALDEKIALLQTEIVADKANADERLNRVDRDLVEYFPFITAAARIALETGMDLEAFRRPTEALRESVGQGTPAVEKKTEGAAKKDKGKGRAVELEPKQFIEQPTRLPPKKDYKGKGRAVELGPKPFIAQPSRLPPKKAYKSKKQDTGSSSTENVQQSVSESEATTSGTTQGNPENPASTSSATPTEASSSIEETRQQVHLGKRKFDEINESDEESEFDPATKDKGKGRAVEFEPKRPIAQPSRLPPKKAYKGKGKAVEFELKPSITSSLLTAPNVSEDKNQETEPSTTEQVQESADESEATTSGATQGNVEDPASASSATPMEASPAIEEPRQEVQPGKRKFDNISKSDEEPELPPTKKASAPKPPTKDKEEETESSTTGKAQESINESGESQGSEDYPPFSIEVTGQEVQPSKRKFDDVGESDEEPEQPPAKKK